MSEIENDINAKSRIYEIGLQIVPTLGDAGASDLFARLQENITTRGGEILQQGSPEKIDLAYTMSQIIENKKVDYREAYFAWFKCETSPSFAKEMEKMLQNDNDIIRSIVFKTVRANTLLPRKTMRKRSTTGERTPEEVIRDEFATNETVIPEPEIEPEIVPDIEVDETVLDKKLSELA